MADLDLDLVVGVLLCARVRVRDRDLEDLADVDLSSFCDVAAADGVVFAAGDFRGLPRRRFVVEPVVEFGCDSL